MLNLYLDEIFIYLLHNDNKIYVGLSIFQKSVNNINKMKNNMIIIKLLD